MKPKASDATRAREFLERWAGENPTHEPFSHDPEVCALCFQTRLWHQVAKEMVERGEYDIGVWCDETTRRWRDGKFYKLWQEEKAAGRDPHKAFEERGWEP